MDGRMQFARKDWKTEPVVSICLPVLNGEAFLQQSLESALGQTFGDFELVIVDDCSTDSSTEIIRQFAHADQRIVWWQNEVRLGLFENYNRCMDRAIGTFIKPFAQDDLLAPQMLSKQVALLNQHPDSVLATTKRMIIDEFGRPVSEAPPNIAEVLGEQIIYPGKLAIEASLKCHLNNLIGEPCAVMFRKSRKGSGFCTTLRHLGDLEYWLRILASGDLAFINEPLAMFRKHRHAATTKNVSQLLAYSDIVLLAHECKRLLADINYPPEQFIKDNLATLARGVPRNSAGEVDLTGLSTEVEITAADVIALKKAFLYAVSMIKPDLTNRQAAHQVVTGLKKALHSPFSVSHREGGAERVRQLFEHSRALVTRIQRRLRSDSFELTEKEKLSLALCQPLFDADFYLRDNLDVAEAGRNAWVHYVRFGFKEGRRPNPLFDTSWYLQQNPDVAASGENPLEHYVTKGADQGCNPNPLFDGNWYRRQNPEVDEQLLNPLVHYIQVGWKKGYHPGPNFDRARYVQEHVIPDGMDPFEHCLLHPSIGVPSALLADSEPIALRRQASYFMNPGPGFEVVDGSIIGGAEPKAKVVAFYLPQFHQVPENDQWWGTGFTEWRNVTRAQQRFLGHYQPRLPRDLGFYDLDMAITQERQVGLAKSAGISGFCFYYYFFDGKKMLDAPLEKFASNKKIDFPFCLLWANESWCRLWDGGDDTILLRQSHDPAFEQQLIDDLARHFSHPNYIRVNGRPLFSLYRPDMVPNTAATIGRWREQFHKRHNLNPLFLMCQTFDSLDPRPFGFDGALEFPPHKFGKYTPLVNHLAQALDPDFVGNVCRYSDLVSQSLNEGKPVYDLIRTVVPSWDNEARRSNAGRVWHGSSPQLYEDWLRTAVERSLHNPFRGESFVFINAWNEWAEGAYLEPDIHWGGAYLNATARAIASSAK